MLDILNRKVQLCNGSLIPFLMLQQKKSLMCVVFRFLPMRKEGVSSSKKGVIEMWIYLESSPGLLYFLCAFLVVLLMNNLGGIFYFILGVSIKKQRVK